MAYITVEPLMEQLRTLGGGPTLGASATTNPQLESAYAPTTFPPPLQSSNLWSMSAPLKGISPRATAPSYPFATYTSGNTITNTADPLTPHNGLQDPMS